MTIQEYVTKWKRYLHELKGEGTEAKTLLNELNGTWLTFTHEQQIEAVDLICGGVAARLSDWLADRIDRRWLRRGGPIEDADADDSPDEDEDGGVLV